MKKTTNATKRVDTEDPLAEAFGEFAEKLGLKIGVSPTIWGPGGFAVGLYFMAAATMKDPSLAEQVARVSIHDHLLDEATEDAARLVGECLSISHATVVAETMHGIKADDGGTVVKMGKGAIHVPRSRAVN